MSYTKKLSFLDATNKRFNIEIETNRGYFSMCSQTGQGQFEPANEPQQKLLDIWNKYHLENDYPSNLDSTIEILKEEILKLETKSRQTFLKYSSEAGGLVTVNSNGEKVDIDFDVVEKIESEFPSDDTDKIIAIMLMFNLPLENISDLITHERDNYWIIEGEDYLFGTDSEMDDEWDQDLDNYLDECVLSELPETVRIYFDKDAWKSNARMDGRGHSLNRWGGGDLEQKWNDEWYYAYQQ